MNPVFYQKIALSFAVCGILLISQKGNAQSVIDLSKPVSDSLKPNGVYWTFDEVETESGFAIVRDSSGNGYDGKLTPGELHPAPTSVNGRFGKAVYFKGNTPSYEGANGKPRTRSNPRVTWKLSDTPNAWEVEKLDMNDTSFTGGAWIRFDSFNSGEDQRVMIFDRGLPSGGSGWAFILVKTPADQWEFWLLGSRSTAKTRLNEQQWHHVGFSLKVTKGEGEITFWLDGEPLGATVKTTRFVGPVSDSARSRIFTVGERNIANYTTGFLGAIDDAFITTGVHGFKPAQ